MLDDIVRTEIHRRLRHAESEHDVRILFAIESGSRAWGFASPNSDYDVRFVYAHSPSWYQAVDLEERRDIIEYPIVDDIDLNGWDLRKALRLFWKSNPTFVEWIQSPIVYIEQGQFRKLALAALPTVYSPVKGVYHYRSMAKTNYRSYLRTKEVPLKKYFYVLRPLMAARWLLNTGAAAPIEFKRLLSTLEREPELVEEIQGLLEKKRTSPELGLSPSVPSLNRFIESELDVPLADAPKKSTSPGVVALLNEIFHVVLAEHEANNGLQRTSLRPAAEP